MNCGITIGLRSDGHLNQPRQYLVTDAVQLRYGLLHILGVLCQRPEEMVGLVTVIKQTCSLQGPTTCVH